MIKTANSLVVALGISSLILISLHSLACSKEQPPSRPLTVPQDAQWAGGPDGGCWVRCSIDVQRDVNYCVAYLDTTGDIMQSGDFRLRGLHRAARLEELSYSWCDGSLIGLKKQLVLEPIVTPTPILSLPSH
jgi:hypothetical protein